MIKLENLGCMLGDFRLAVDFTVNEGEYFVILGPNGAGKTVLLETIAGFNKAEKGKIHCGGREINDLPPEKRGIGIVYQDDALFPHLSVMDNVLYGLRARKLKQEEISSVLDWVTGITGISDLLFRKPLTLSGGERRKVALARALSIKPEVLLLDEPLNALDPETRDKMILELNNIHRLLKITTIHVCHDFSEAITLGERIAVMESGQVRQIGTPYQIFRQPNSEFVARFTMARNIFKGEVSLDKGGNAVFRTGDIGFRVAGDAQEVTNAAIRPDDISISTGSIGAQGNNYLRGKISRISDNGSVIYITVTVPPDFICQVNRRALEEMGLKEQMEVYLSFRPSSVSLF